MDSEVSNAAILDTLAAASKRLRLGIPGPSTADELDAYAAALAQPSTAITNSALLQDTDAPAHPVAREVGRIGDMSTSDALRVGFDGDNDVYLSTTSMVGVEFCTSWMGGGKSPRTRAALVALMVAMEADNADDPRRDWWAKRNGVAQEPKAAPDLSIPRKQHDL